MVANALAKFLTGHLLSGSLNHFQYSNLLHAVLLNAAIFFGKFTVHVLKLSQQQCSIKSSREEGCIKVKGCSSVSGAYSLEHLYPFMRQSAQEYFITFHG